MTKERMTNGEKLSPFEPKNRLGVRIGVPTDRPATERLRKKALSCIGKKYADMAEEKIKAAKTVEDLLQLLSFYDALKPALKTAEELCYDQQCVKELKKAKNAADIERIMVSARHRFWDKVEARERAC